MKTMVLLLLVVALSTNANDAARISEAMSPAMRYRIFDGKLIDIGPMAKKALEGGSVGEEWFLIDGTISQVVPSGGLLVKDRSKSDIRNPVFVTNYPHEHQSVDGDRIKVFTKRSGRFTYDTASGSVRTTESFDCGAIPTPEQTKKLKDDAERRSEEAKKAATKISDQRKAEWATKKLEVEKKALEFQTKRAEEGSAQAQYDLGMRYFNGDGVDVDIEKSVSWLKKAAEQGHTGAKQKLSSFFMRYDTPNPPATNAPKPQP